MAVRVADEGGTEGRNNPFLCFCIGNHRQAAAVANADPGITGRL